MPPPQPRPPINLTETILPLALPLTDPSSLYTKGQASFVLDRLGNSVKQNLSLEECDKFTDVLKSCVEGLTGGRDPTGRGWERVKKVVGSMDDARAAHAARYGEAAKQGVLRVAGVKAESGDGEVKSGAEAALAPSTNSSTAYNCNTQALDTETLPQTTLQPPAPTPPAPGPKQPFLRAFLSVIAPLCDDPEIYTFEQRAKFFKALHDFFETNLTPEEQARFSVTLDECCEYSISDPEKSNGMMREMIHRVARERIERSVRETRVGQVVQVMGDVKERMRGKGEEKEKWGIGGDGTGEVTSGPGLSEVSKPVKPPLDNAFAAGFREAMTSSEAKSAMASKLVASGIGPASSTHTRPAKVKEDTDEATADTTNPTDIDHTHATTSPSPSPLTLSPPFFTKKNGPERPLKLPRLPTHDLDTLISLPNPQRTHLYLRMLFEPVTSQHVIQTAELYDKYYRTFAHQLETKLLSEVELARGSQNGEDGPWKLKGEWKWGGILSQENFVGVLLRTIPGMELVVNMHDQSDERVWIRGLQERSVALTFAGTARKRERKMLQHYRVSGQVDAAPKTAFAAKLVADPLFARPWGHGGPSPVIGTLPRRVRTSQKKGTVVGCYDGEERGFPGVGLKARLSESAMREFEVRVTEGEMVWPGRQEEGEVRGRGTKRERGEEAGTEASEDGERRAGGCC